MVRRSARRRRAAPTPSRHALLVRVLVTGSHGLVGGALVRALQGQGDVAIGYDLVDGCDVLDGVALVRAAKSTDAIVHLAAVDEAAPGQELPDAFLPRSVGTPETVAAVTVVGTANALEAASAAGHTRIVVMSSVDALGIFLGQRPPDYLPIDDAHPTYSSSPFAIAKRTAERLCEAFSARTGIASLCLRPPGVWTEETFALVRARFAEDPLNDRRPFWEYGAFIALSDLSAAVCAALRCPLGGHMIVHVAADDAALARQTSREAARSIHPAVPFRGGANFETEPFRSLLDNTRGKVLLGWTPRVRFRP